MINRLSYLVGKLSVPWMPANTTKFKTLDQAIQAFLNLASAVSALIAVCFLIYGGVQYILSSGDSTKAEKAQTTIVYALVGLVIIALAYLIVGFVLRVIGGSFQSIDT